MEKNIEDIIMAASEGDDAAVAKLFNELEGLSPSELGAMASSLDFMFEAWEDGVSKSDEKAKLCLMLAETGALDSPAFRNALNDAVRRMLPPYLGSPGVVKAVGSRDSDTPVRDVAARLKKLQRIKTGALLCQTESGMWGKVSTIDKVTASIGAMSLFGSSVSSVPVSVALSSAVFFDSTPELLGLLSPDRKAVQPSSRYRWLFRKLALIELSDSKMKDMVFKLIVPETMPMDAFAAWWASDEDGNGSGLGTSQRMPWEARSVLELHTLLSGCEESGGVRLGVEEGGRLSGFFLGLKNVAPKDVGMLAECIAMLAGVNEGGRLGDVVRPLLGKAPFWPVEPDAAQLKELEVWGKLSMKTLGNFIKAALCVYEVEALARLGARLPLRCMGQLFNELPEDKVAEAVQASKPLLADSILWMWKGKSKVPSRLLELIDMDKVADALSLDGMPKEWGSAQRELKKTLFDKAEFQKFVIENADGDMPSIFAALQRVRNFQHGEHQSIMVKLSRHSQELKDYIAGGEGRKLMEAGAGSTAGGSSSAPQQPPITSIRSHKELVKELDDIVKVHIPENVAAISHARGFGDFRENAEYDAAKERRRFLNRRRSELESLVGTVQPTDFKDVKVDGKAVLGSTVKVEADGGAVREYHIVGAWDGDPDRHCISYRTKLGEVLLGLKVGDKAELPGGERCVIKDVAPLPEELRRRLSDEK